MPGIGFVLKSLFAKEESNNVNPFVSRQTPDVLEVLTEVDEKSRRCPEMIQYFIVSLTPKLECVWRSGARTTCHKYSPPPPPSVCHCFAERPAKTHDLLRRAVSEHGLQPGPALHAEQPSVSSQW